jgi:hypothetical protein
MSIILNIVCFILGAAFGFGIFACLRAAQEADEELLKSKEESDNGA